MSTRKTADAICQRYIVKKPSVVSSSLPQLHHFIDDMGEEAYDGDNNDSLYKLGMVAVVFTLDSSLQQNGEVIIWSTYVRNQGN